MVFYAIPSFSVHTDDELQYITWFAYSDYRFGAGGILWFKKKLYCIVQILLLFCCLLDVNCYDNKACSWYLDKDIRYWFMAQRKR